MKDKDIQRMYVSAKIKYNPLEYTLSDRLLMETSSLPSVMDFGYDSENQLLDIICKKMSSSKTIVVCDLHSVYDKYFKYSGTNTYLGSLKTFHNDEFALLMNYRNNLSVDWTIFRNLVGKVVNDKEYMGSSVSDKHYIDDCIENGNYLESIATLNIALRDSSSILPVLKLAEFTEYLSYSYEDLVNAKYIKDYLDNATLNLPIAYVSLRDSIICNNKNYFFENAGLSNEDREFCSKISCFNTVLYGIEILHAIESIKDDTIKQTLYYLLSYDYNPSSIVSLLYKSVGKKIEINKDIQDIINENDNRKRFKNLCLYMCREDVLKQITEIGEDLNRSSKLSQYATTDFMSLMVIFCMEYSLQCVRSKNILALLDYIKEKGFKLDFDEDGTTSKISSGLSELLGSETTSTDSDDTDTSTTTTDKPVDSMLDFHKHPHGISGSFPKTESKFKKTPALKALDEAISSFNDGVFGYDVRDVIDTSDKYKDRYNAIVDNVALLNKTLIKRIKDIKVYNEGGKNPGLSSGKLDMKNIHKYKTTDKIFCKNTYKIKESDLAFGIILDVSGSMHGDGIKNGVITMVILHETLKALNINHSIITHTEHKGYHTCEIKRYQNFREQSTYNVRKNYALAGIVAESGNCDAAALKYMETAFKKVRNRDKICLIFSDGEPTECSDSELLEQVAHMEKNGIKVIGIGVNFSNIKEYYRDNANGKNLKDMLDIVSNILKQYILDKKE